MPSSTNNARRKEIMPITTQKKQQMRVRHWHEQTKEYGIENKSTKVKMFSQTMNRNVDVSNIAEMR